MITVDCLEVFLAQTHAPSADALQCAPLALEDVRRILQTSPWQEEMIQHLREGWDSLYHGMPLVVRSSATAEDSVNASFAGVFHTSVGVRSFGEFLEAIRECWQSGYGASAVQYVSRLGEGLPRMGVIVQPLVNSVAAGVAFLSDGHLRVSAAYGLCVGAVTGTAACDTFIWEDEEAEPTIRVRSKENAWIANMDERSYWFGQVVETIWENGRTLRLHVLGSDSRQALLNCALPPELREAPVLAPDTARRLSRMLYGVVHSTLGPGDWDMEWCIDAAGEVFLLQARPVTARTVSAAPGVLNCDLGSGRINGEPISPGVATGPACVISGPSDLSRILQGDILVMEGLQDNLLTVLSRAGAIVIAESSPLTHSAILAREWRIPCVGGVVLGTLAEGRYYKVDGTTGEIRLHEGLTGEVESTVKTPTPSKIVSIHGWLAESAAITAARPDDGVFEWCIERWRRLLENCEVVDLSGVEGLQPEYRFLVDAALAVAWSHRGVQKRQHTPLI